jgi:hypothetical protein
MSNNQQTMKLYTEEEILSFLKIHLADEDQADSFVALLTPIELPSDEEMEKYAKQFDSLTMYLGVKIGVKLIMDKIQGGNNEN